MFPAGQLVVFACFRLQSLQQWCKRKKWGVGAAATVRCCQWWRHCFTDILQQYVLLLLLLAMGIMKGLQAAGTSLACCSCILVLAPLCFVLLQRAFTRTALLSPLLADRDIQYAGAMHQTVPHMPPGICFCTPCDLDTGHHLCHCCT